MSPVIDIWIASSYDPEHPGLARGAWLCPTLDTYGITKYTKAYAKQDAHRVGCAMAILSALDCLGDNLLIHIPDTPYSGWVTHPTQPIPMPHLIYRVLYRLEAYPRILDKSIQFVTYTTCEYTERLHALLQTKQGGH